MNPDYVDWAEYVAERFGDRGLQLWGSPARDSVTAIYTILSSLDIRRREHNSLRALRNILSSSDGTTKSLRHEMADIMTLRDNILYIQPPGKYKHLKIGKGLYSDRDFDRFSMRVDVVALQMAWMEAAMVGKSMAAETNPKAFSEQSDFAKSLLSRATFINMFYPSFSPSSCTNLTYTPLSENSWFRLVVLEPGEFEDDIVCHLVPIRKDDAQQMYEALSYTWSFRGLDNTREEMNITCNGHFTTVEQNLGLALRWLRSTSEPRIIWADQLSINQSDKREQSEQVQAMSSVYTQAKDTIIWLGHDEHNDAHEAFKAVCRLVNSWDATEHATYQTWNDNTKTYDHQKPSGRFSKSAWHKIGAMYGCTWFQRRWVIQEAALSKSATVYWGRAKVSWRHVGLAAAILRMQHLNLLQEWDRWTSKCWISGVYHAYLIFRLSQQKALPPMKLSFLNLLRLTQAFNTTMSHDVVYALLGITTSDNDPDGERFLDADYTIPANYLWLKVAEKMLETGSLAFLCNAGLEKRGNRVGERVIPRYLAHCGEQDSVDDGPTWVPTWKRSPNSMMAPWTIGLSYSPSKGLPFKRWKTDNATHLAVDGVQVGIVLWTSQMIKDGVSSNADELRQLVRLPAFQSPPSDSMAPNFLKLIKGQALNFFPGREIAASKETLQRFARALSAGRDAYGALDNNRSSLTGDFTAFLAQTERLEETRAAVDRLGDAHTEADVKRYRSLADKIMGRKDLQRFFQVADTISNRRRLFVTSSGHLGYGPEYTRPGDVVVILGGANMPLMLRKKDALYQLLGECFIDDIMFGEAVQAMQKGEQLRGHFDVDNLVKGLFSFEGLEKEDKVFLQSELGNIMEYLKKEYQVLKVRRFDLS
ncbi:hypothetical protein BU16DRAFT_594392 [Lophium mytilinum]|uniref:Heterokaryon incompatibility domain-containing protein n=1 Tax=Lophium mytilinum TaxID=390894 RepID=A0A6A6QGZ7_9PEZI|nr:hypothetical protein BU16DRAFT_594392 [Lophium mytilinum]